MLRAIPGKGSSSREGIYAAAEETKKKNRSENKRELARSTVATERKKLKKRMNDERMKRDYSPRVIKSWLGGKKESRCVTGAVRGWRCLSGSGLDGTWEQWASGRWPFLGGQVVG
jgi:hypothetical protein